ncbi:MAG: pyrimidine dimer DNA glycosylase/endonuclease V [Candidatus Kapabacteria bacterium]|nr:pyrimidine dimer DNA glycosylase/endonuclease V [Candidatus Kapabacteria bacterium]
MRIWSLHPKYLDQKGLVALWRESLLAKHVLEGRTKGYRNHPQLDRFKSFESPLDAINQYLSEIYKEAARIGYNFDIEKINWDFKESRIAVTLGQINYESAHFLRKLKIRDFKKYTELSNVKTFDTHPLFYLVEGGIENWERINKDKLTN